MTAYDLPKTEHYPTLERVLNPPAIVQRLSNEKLKGLRNPLELILAQITNSNTGQNVPCVVNGQSVDNCVDMIYKSAESADDIYPGAKVTPRNTKFATRYKFLDVNGSEWMKYFFDSGEISKKTQDIFKEDSRVNFEAFYRLHIMYKGKIEKVGLFREGFIVIGISDRNIGGYIIPISLETIEKLIAL